MAKIAESVGRSDENSGYARLFGNALLGQLLSRVQAAVIRSGNELERLLWEATPHKATMLELLQAGQLLTSAKEVLVVSGQVMAQYSRSEPRTDILILDLLRQEVSVVELKDGDTFDTKKAAGEKASAIKVRDWIAPQVRLPVRYYFCSFNQADKNAIVKGIKSAFTVEQVLTGAELCERIEVDYDAIRLWRRRDQEENLTFFITNLARIPEARRLLQQELRKTLEE